MEPAPLPHTQPIRQTYIDRLVLESCDVQKRIVRVALRARPKGSVRVSLDQLAEIAGCVAAQNAVVLNQVRTERRDDIRNLDVCVIDGGAKSWQERGCQHQTHIRSLPDLGLEVRVATEKTVILACGRARCGHGDRLAAVRQRAGGCVRRSGGRERTSGTKIRTAVQLDDIRIGDQVTPTLKVLVLKPLV